MALDRLLIDAATRDPTAVAVVDGAQSWSYETLAERAGGIQQALRVAGVRPGDRVVALLRKSAEAVATVHATLAMGAVYVPLDAGSPDARLQTICADSRPRVIVADSRTRKRATALAGAVGATVVDLDDVSTADELVVGSVDGANLGYVLYTSGSTGRPKGVMLSHTNGRHFVDWAIDTLELTAADRFSSHAPFHFDLSVLDLFAPAALGARVVLVSPTQAMFPVALAELIDDQEVTVWYSVPTALRLLVERGGLANTTLPSLRHVVFAGEVFPPQRLRELMAHVPAARYWNFFGPTETNVCTYHEVTSPPGDEPVPIGEAIDGVRALIVDDGAEVIDGRVGELWISGPTVFAGYWDDDAATERAFAPDPADPAGPPMYRTGDLVSRGSTGLIYHGRIDHQVKSRGHRIELGEVERALTSHARVSDAIVVTVADDTIGHALVAYVAGEVEAPALATYCASIVPDYMVPGSIELIDEMPRTSTGKIDRLTLTAWAESKEQTESKP